jgi:HPt (histidine-containing phosphotransfer) domain-containing protein
MEVTLTRVDGDRQLLAELSTFFLQDHPRFPGEAKRSILKGDPSGLERAAHTLR